MAEEVKKVKAKKQSESDSIQYNEENKTMALLACLPYVSIILFFIEDDEFVKYVAAQYSLVGLTPLVFLLIAWIPCIGAILMILASLLTVGLVIYGLVTISQGKVIHVPGYKDLAVKLMNSL